MNVTIITGPTRPHISPLECCDPPPPPPFLPAPGQHSRASDNQHLLHPAPLLHPEILGFADPTTTAFSRRTSTSTIITFRREVFNRCKRCTGGIWADIPVRNPSGSPSLEICPVCPRHMTIAQLLTVESQSFLIILCYHPDLAILPLHFVIGMRGGGGAIFPHVQPR